jgi:protein gp37
MGRSTIEWTTSTWNPVTGCSKVSAGCQHCYAERLSYRLMKMGNPSYSAGFQVRIHERLLNLPAAWKKPQTVFVNSMSDLFHEEVPLQFIQKVFNTMGTAKWHQYQILTKRAGRLKELAKELEWHPNIWMGVSVEDQDNTGRIDSLRSIPAAVKFLSLEPLIGPIEQLDLEGINWVIVGGESGPGARPMKREWVVAIRDACKKAGVPFFFKQWGGTNKKQSGRLLDNRTWDEMPRKLGVEEELCLNFV